MGNSWKPCSPHFCCLLHSRKKDAECNCSLVLHGSAKRWTNSGLARACMELSFQFKGRSTEACATSELGVAEATAEGSQPCGNTCEMQQWWRALQMDLSGVGLLGKPGMLQHMWCWRKKTKDVPGYKTCLQGECGNFGAGNLLLLLGLIAHASSLLKREVV